MTETILLRTDGGPFPGVRYSTDDYPFPWPPPERLKLPPELPLPQGWGLGYYQKVSHSQLPEPPTSGLVRAARYEWRTGEPPE